MRTRGPRAGFLLAVLMLTTAAACEQLPGSADSLQVGECFDVPTSEAEVSTVQHKPCGDPHTGEVFFAGDHPADSSAAFPSADEIDAYLAKTCTPAFNAYTGLDFDTDQTYGYGYFFPVESGWSSGDRGVSCYITRMDDGPMTGSLKKG